jgi:hypothetical protein
MTRDQGRLMEKRMLPGRRWKIKLALAGQAVRLGLKIRDWNEFSEGDKLPL